MINFTSRNEDRLYVGPAGGLSHILYFGELLMAVQKSWHLLLNQNRTLFYTVSDTALISELNARSFMNWTNGRPFDQCTVSLSRGSDILIGSSYRTLTLTICTGSPFTNGQEITQNIKLFVSSLPGADKLSVIIWECRIKRTVQKRMVDSSSDY